MEAYRAALEAERRRRVRRAVTYSAVGHVVVLGALALAPAPEPAFSLPGVVTVDLVAASALSGGAVPPPARPRREAPKPRPAPEQPAPPPTPAKRAVVLPEDLRRDPKPKEKAKPEPEPEPKPEPKREPRQPRPAPPPPPQDRTVEYDDLLAQLRQEKGEQAPQPIDRELANQSAEAGGGSGRSAARGGGQQVSPEVEAWIRRARLHVGRTWVVPVGFRDAKLQVEVNVELDASGAVVGEPSITRRSGNPWYDEGVVRAIQKASPLPRPPEAGVWPFIFRPEDLE